jgi:hypothetical protein
MKPEFILMLTYNDTTVKDALKIFHECKVAPVAHWGFKDVGLPPEEMKALVREMKEAGNTTYLEVVSLSEEGQGAQSPTQASISPWGPFLRSDLAYLKGKPIILSVSAHLRPPQHHGWDHLCSSHACF